MVIMKHQKPVISVRNVSLSFWKKHVLKNVSFDLFNEDVISIIGPNGAWKTSLLKVLAWVYKPNSWTVTTTANPVSYVPQKLQFDHTIPLTVKEFIQFYNPWVPYENIIAALRDIKMEGFIDSFLGKLSWGELQKITIAQAICSKPAILLLDEPTASIDKMWADAFFELLVELNKQRKMTIVLVSHNLRTVFAQSDRVICLNKKLCCMGKPAEVSEDTHFKKIFGNHLAPYHHHHDHWVHHTH